MPAAGARLVLVPVQLAAVIPAEDRHVRSHVRGTVAETPAVTVADTRRISQYLLVMKYGDSEDLSRQPTQHELVLSEFGLESKDNWPWLNVKTTTITAGWKLHISSTPSQIVSLLNAVCPILSDFEVPFKVVRDEEACILLNEGAFGTTQIGKCITVYASQIDAPDRLAEQLIKATENFVGPTIISDVYLGSQIYTRYGAFTPEIERDLLGQFHSRIRLPSGEWTNDGYVSPSDYLSYPGYPFAKSPFLNQPVTPLQEQRLFKSRYLLVDVIDSRPRGATFQAIDVEDPKRVTPNLLKQGRYFTLSDSQGRDIRDRFKHEKELYQIGSSIGISPSCDAYFEENGAAYLVLEYIFGDSCESKIQNIHQDQQWRFLDRERKLRILEWIQGIIRIVRQLHQKDIVHRDISPSNVFICDDGRILLIDFELAQPVGSKVTPFGKGTPGFMAPEQESWATPCFSQDVYAVGALVLFAMSGLDPRRILGPQKILTPQNLQNLIPETPQSFQKCLHSCFDTKPENRPSLQDLSDEVHNVTKTTNSNSFGFHCDCKNNKSEELLQNAKRKLHSGINGLQSICIRSSDKLWLSSPIKPEGDRLGSQIRQTELRRGLNRGIAGICYLAAEVSNQQEHASFYEDCQKAVRWLLDEEQTPDYGLPGLHFGEAGVCNVIQRIADADIINLSASEKENLLTKTFQQRSHWPDFTHGAAGQGIAAMQSSHWDRNGRLTSFIESCAEYLIDTQEEAGAWKMPEGVPGMSGETLTGFAHGVAGIAYFLAEFGQRYHDQVALAKAEKAASWLIDNSTNENGRLRWRYSDNNQDIWNWWCHGAPGISILFRSLWLGTSDPKYKRLLERSLELPQEGFISGNLSLCHGMCGLGLLFLDAFHTTEDSRYYQYSEQILEHVISRATMINDCSYWIVEDTSFITADLMVGMSGVLLYLYAHSQKEKSTATFPGLLI